MATTRKVKGKEPHQPEEAAVVPKGEKSILKVKETAEEAKKMLESLTREYQDVLDESAGLFGDISITHTRLLEILRSGDDLAKREVTKLYNEVNKLLDAAKKLENKARAEKQKLEESKALAAASPEPPKAEPLAVGEPPKKDEPAPIEKEPAKTKEQKEKKTDNVKLLEAYLSSNAKPSERFKVLKAVLTSEQAIAVILGEHRKVDDEEAAHSRDEPGKGATAEQKLNLLASDSVYFLTKILSNFEFEDELPQADQTAFIYAMNACEILSGVEDSKPGIDFEMSKSKEYRIKKDIERQDRAKSLPVPAGVPLSLVSIIKGQLDTLSRKGSVLNTDPDTMTGVAREAARRTDKTEPPKPAEPATAFAEGVVEVELNEGKEIEDVLTEDQKLIIDDVLDEVIRKFLGRDKNDILQIKITNKIGETSRVDFNEITERRIMRDGRIVRPLKAAGITSSQLWNYFPEWLEKNGLGRSRADATAGWENAGDILAADPDEIKTLTDKQKSNIADVLRYPFRPHLQLNSKNELIDSRNNKPAGVSFKEIIYREAERPYRLQEGLRMRDVLGYLDEWLEGEKARLIRNATATSAAEPAKTEPAPIDPLAPPVPKATTKPPEKVPEKPKSADENFVMEIARLDDLDNFSPEVITAAAGLFHKIFDGKSDAQKRLIIDTNSRLHNGYSLGQFFYGDLDKTSSKEEITKNLEYLGDCLRMAAYYSTLDKEKQDAIDETAGVMEEELRKWAEENNYYGVGLSNNQIVGSMFSDALKYEAHVHGGPENRIKYPDAKKIAITHISEFTSIPALTAKFSARKFDDVKAIDALTEEDLKFILDNCNFDASPVGNTRDARLRQRLGVQRMKVWCQENVKPEGRRTTVEINYSSGDKYIGEVDAEDKPHGRGVGYYKNGDVYDGQYEHGKRSGIGRLINKGILMYDGDWDNDVYHGSGWLHYNILVGAEKKDRYLVGDFENGKPKGLMKIFARSGDPTPMATKDFTGDEFDFLFELAALETSTPVTTETADELPEVDKDETPEEEDSNKLFFADEILEIIGAEKLKDVLRKFTTDTPDQVKQALKDLFSAPLNPVMKARLKEKKIFGEFDSEVEVKFLLWWKGNRGPDTENGAEVFYNAFQYQLVSEIERQAAANPDLQAVEKGKFWSKGSIIRLARAILPGAGAGLAVTTTIGTGGLSLFAAAFAGVIISRVFRSGNVQLEREEKGGQKKKVEGGWLTRLGRTISNKFSTAGERQEEVDLVRLRTVTSAIDEFKGKFLNRADNPEAAAEMMAAHLATTITEEEIKYPVRDYSAKIAHVDALKIIAERAEARKTQAGEYQATIEAKGKLAEYLVAALDFNNDKMRRNEVVAEAERKIAGQNNGLAVVWDEMKKGNLLNLGFGSGKVLSKEWLIGTVVEGAVVTTTVAAGAAGTALTAGKAWWAGLLARAGFRAGVAATFGAFEGASGFGTKEKEEYARELLVETRQKFEETKNVVKEYNDTENMTDEEEDKMKEKFITNLAGLIAINNVADEELKELKLFETAEGRRLYTEMQEFLAIVDRDFKYPDNFTQKVDEAVDELVSSRQNQYKIAGKTGKKIKTALTSGAKRAAMVGAISAGIEGGRLVMGGGGSGFARIQEGEAKVFATSQKGDVGFFDKGEKIEGFSPSESSVAPAGSGGHAPKIPDEGSTPEPVPIQAAEPTPEPISTEPKVLATHVAGTGHDKGSLIGSMQAMQEKLTAENLAAIRAHHPQWAKLGDAKLIDRWRIEMARQHGQTFDREGQYFKTVFKKGDVVSLVEEADGYPKIELNKTHTLARPHFVPRDGVQPVVEAAPPEAEAPKPTAAMKLTEAVNAGRTEVAGVELPAGSKVTHADFNPDFPNLVDLSITDASGNVQHHLYRAGEGAGGGAESAPALKRVNAFEVGLAKAPVGTESAIKTATSSFAARPVGVSGGGVHQGTDVLGKEKLVGAPVVETAMRSKAVGLADHLKTTDARAKYLFMSPKFKNEAADIIKEFASQYVKDHPGVDLNKSDDLKNFEELWKTESLKYFTNVKTNGGVVGGGAESQGAVPEESTVAEIAPKGKGVAVEPAVEAEKVKPTSAKVVKTAPETAAPKEPAVEAVLASKDKPIVVGGKLADGRHLVSVYNAGKATADKLFLPEKTKPSLEDGLLRMNVNNVSRAGELRLAKVGGAEKWVWDIDAGDQTDRYVLDKLDNNGYGEAIALPKED